MGKECCKIPKEKINAVGIVILSIVLSSMVGGLVTLYFILKRKNRA